MENNYKTLRMPELKALARECRLRGYSRLRKAELITLPQNSTPQAQKRQRPPRPSRTAPPPPQTSTWEPQREPQTKVSAPLTKRQLKRRQNRDSKLAKHFVSLNAEISNLKSRMEELEGKITRPSESTNARFKRKKIRTMKHEAGKIAERLAESEAALSKLKPRVPMGHLGVISESLLKLHPPNAQRHIVTKIADLNKKIRRARENKTRSALIAKREAGEGVRSE